MNHGKCMNCEWYDKGQCTFAQPPVKTTPGSYCPDYSRLKMKVLKFKPKKGE